jgi:hypothetical protein
MSTLYQRPPSEDPTAYASAEAMVEIQKRVGRGGQIPGSPAPIEPSEGGIEPTVGPDPRDSAVQPDIEPTAGHNRPSEMTPTEGIVPPVGRVAPRGIRPTVGIDQAAVPSDSAAGNAAGNPSPAAPGTSSSGMGGRPTVGTEPSGCEADTTEPPGRAGQPGSAMEKQPRTAASVAAAGPVPTAGPISPVGMVPAAGTLPTVGVGLKSRIKPIREIRDALTLAGQILYRAMYGVSEAAASRTCTKGYRQLAGETRLDKDTVRDLIREFKEKGIVREIGTYDPDTRSAKTYEVFPEGAIIETWQKAGVAFVTAGRQRPAFCSAHGQPLTLTRTTEPEPGRRLQREGGSSIPTVGVSKAPFGGPETA